jgi:hypothetical protein
MTAITAKVLRLAKDFALPQEAVTETFAIIAKRGVGKTYTAAVMTEELLKAGLPVVVIDPIGVWWGLRASADGKHEGLPIIVLGGDHGDAPLEEHAGEIIAAMIVEDRLSLVIDLSLFRKGQQVRFMTDFCEALYRKNRQALHLVMDEADAFAPQRPMPGEQRLLGAVEDLVRRGRARGIGVTLVTQRAAVLNKNVLTQVEVLVTLRTIAPQDRAAVDEWIKVHGTPEQRNALMESLASLPIGTAWFWSPGWLDVFQRVQIRKRETFDSSSTPEAQAGVKVQPKLAAVDLAAIKARIAETIERVKSDDPRELRRRIAELEGELRKKPAAAIDAARESEIRKGAALAVHVKYAPIAVQVADLAAQAAEVSRRLESLRRAGLEYAAQPAEKDVTLKRIERRDDEKRTGMPLARVTPVTRGEKGLPSGERAVLTACAQYPKGATREQLTVLTGYKRSSRDTYLQRLREKGYVTIAGNTSQATRPGVEALGPDFTPLPTGARLRDYWLERLPEGERKILGLLMACYPRALDRLSIDRQTDYKRSSRDTYIQRLRSRQLLEIVAGGEVRASEELFG